MNLVGKNVQHRIFGTGKIVDQANNLITVAFLSGAGERKFGYPECFQTFMKLLDSEISDEVQKEAEQHKQEKESEQRQKIDEAQSKIASNRNSGNENSVSVQPFATVADFCQAYRQALRAEISFIRKTGGRHIHLQDGKLIEKGYMRYVYLFESEDELSYPDGTPAVIWKGQSQIAGKILSCESFEIYLSSEMDLGTEVESLDISAEAYFLLQSVSERLIDLSFTQSGIVQNLVCNGVKAIEYRNHEIIKGQSEAVRLSNSQPITFIWGPPGTGKTQTLAKIAWEHINKGERVLMVSYSNVSVDGAILRVAKMGGDLKPGTLVRYGFPKDEAILNHPYLSAYNLAIYKNPELLKLRDELLSTKKVLDKHDPRRLRMEERLEEIRKNLKTAEKQYVRNARFVATTVSKAIVDRDIRGTSYDVVIFDEASMALIPQIVYAASLSKKHFVCMGDFRQLPPIVQSGRTSILNADIFQYCGITQAVDQECNHKWLCMLDTQYRMHPEIADFASKCIYNNWLKSAGEMAGKRENTVRAEPFSGYAIEVVDLSRTMSTCIKTSDDSHANILSAFVTFSLALKSAQTQEVGIITPYHAQSRLLHAMVRDAEELKKLQHSIKCATVHQFQGSEEDVILYDAVDCYRLPYPGALIASTAGRYADRLFNVAMTRSKGKFICVANRSFMKNKGTAERLMFMQLLKEYETKSPDIASVVCNDASVMKYDLTFPDEEARIDAFIRDLNGARREIRMDIPDPMSTAEENAVKIAQALSDAQSRGVKVFVRAEAKKNLHQELKCFTVENHYLTDPVTLIDKTVVWFGMPESGACFKTEGRTLSVQCRPCIRFWGTHTAKVLYGFLEMSQMNDQAKTVDFDVNGNQVTERFSSYVLAHKKCPTCGKPMQLKKSRSQKYFLSCSGYPSCKHTEFVEPDFVEEYFYHKGNKNGKLCPRCGCSLEAKISQYGIYVQCCGGSHHKYKLDEI